MDPISYGFFGSIESSRQTPSKAATALGFFEVSQSYLFQQFIRERWSAPSTSRDGSRSFKCSADVIFKLRSWNYLRPGKAEHHKPLIVPFLICHGFMRPRQDPADRDASEKSTRNSFKAWPLGGILRLCGDVPVVVAFCPPITL